MMTDSLGDTNAHIISRVDGSGTERRRRDYLRSSEFVVRTGFLADDILGRARRGTHGEGLVFRHLCLAHLFGRGVPHGHQHPDTRVGRCYRISLPCAPVTGSPNPVGHHCTAVALSDLGEVGC